VNEHASLKDCVSLGHHTKVGGEVEGCIIEPFTNKQHAGFLGHSYVGSWVNIGAGTCNSDLKNTYGIVNMNYGGQKVSTGLQFVGCFIGDYAKTAINTSIFTGKTIGVCSLVYGFVTTNVPSFCNYARSLASLDEASESGMTDLPAEVMISIQQRMFVRRQTPQRECDIQLIRDLYAQALRQRQLPNHPLAL
jgi:UDP-N-acetylglucosamine diphosphorylase / glucose-1-phosphate thymidylyltransferase / UDP-N-acetylgalactosamine diphosphorylase / glucosamine-1-phosphate N-acetyltransferase / galactosamine-1-phosphate N-acetyltransferase